MESGFAGEISGLLACRASCEGVFFFPGTRLSLEHSRRLNHPEYDSVVLKFVWEGLVTNFELKKGALVCTLLLSFVSGCALVDSSENGDSVRFRTDHDFYEAIIISGILVRMNVDIATILENQGGEDVVLTGCINPSLPELQKRLDGIWTTVYAAAEPECISPPWFIEPGEMYQDTLRVDAILDPQVVPVLRWESGIPVDGTYRLERRIYTNHLVDEFPGTLLPLSDRVSQVFEIRTRQALTLR